MNSQEDVDKEIQQQKDDDLTDRVHSSQKGQLFADTLAKSAETYSYDQIASLEDHKKNRNFSFMQSLILIAAYIAGSNKESTDGRLFEMEKGRHRRVAHQNNTNQAHKDGGQYLLGKTKRFSFDRLLAITQHLASIEIEGATECKLIKHSLDFYACVNTLVNEDMLTKQVMRTGGLTAEISSGADNLTSVGLKCNFDHNFIQEVAEKINFQLHEYLFRNEIDE